MTDDLWLYAVALGAALAALTVFLSLWIGPVEWRM